MAQTFEDYYKQLAAQPKKTSSPSQPLVFPKAGKPAVEKPPQSPLNWFVDMISRPLFGATTAVGGVLEGVAKSQEEGNPLSAIGGALAIPTNFLAGLTSTDDSPGSGTKRTYGDLMEEYTDRFGGINDPNYVDRPDNVGIEAKGVGGFLLDVVADPLTWIPGGLLLKGAKIPAQAVKTGLEAGSAGVRELAAAGRGGTRTAAETVVKQSDEALPAPRVEEPENLFGGGGIETPSPASIPSRAEVPTSVVPEAPVVGTALTDALEWARKSSDPAIMQTVKRYEAALSKSQKNAISKHEASLVKSYESSVKRIDGVDLETTPKGVVGADTAGERTLREMIDTADATPTMRAEIQGILDTVGKTGTPAKTLNPANWLRTHQEAKGPFQQLPGDRIGKQRTALQLFKIWDAEKGLAAGAGRGLSARGTEAKKTLDAMYREYAQKAGVPTQDVTDALLAFRTRRDADREKVVAALGEELVSTLTRKNTPASMDRAMQNVLKMLDPETDLVKFFSENKQLAPAIQAGLRIPGHIKPTPNTVAEINALETALSGSDRLEPVAEVFAKVLGQETPIGKGFRQRYPHGRGDVVFTEKDPKIRLGNLWRYNNSYFQWTLMKNLRSVLDTRMAASTGRSVAELKARGREFARAYGESVESLGGELVEVIQTFGTKLHIGVQDELLPITFPEVYKGVRAGFGDDTTALLALYNGGSSVAPTVLFQAVHHALNAADLVKLGDEGALALHREIVDILMDPKKYGVRGGLGGNAGKIPNNISKAMGGGTGQARGFHHPKKGWMTMPKGKLAEELATAILRSQEALKATVASNAAMWAERGIAEASRLTNAQISTLRELVENGGWKSAIAKQIDSVPKSIADDATEIGATQSAVNASTEVTRKAIGDENVEIARQQVKLAREVETGKKSRKKAVSETSQKAADDIGRQADEFDPPRDIDSPGVTDDAPTYNLSNPAPVVAQQGFVESKLFGLRNVFDQSFGIKRTWDLLHSKGTIARQYFEQQLHRIHEVSKFAPEVQVAAVKSLQTGVANANPEVARAAALVDQVMSDFWRVSDDVADGRLLDNGFLAVEPNVDHINSILKMKGLPDDFQFSGSTLDEMLESWRQWEFTDPADALVKLSDAVATTAEHRAIVGNFVHTFRGEGLIKDAYQPGYVKIVSSGESTFAGLLPEGIFVEKNLAQELHRLDALTTTDRRLQGEIGTFLSKYFVPAQGIWKSLITVWRPGHHVRNMVGNGAMQWTAFGNRHYISSQRDALRVLGVRNNNPAVDVIDSLRRIGVDEIPSGGDVIIRGRFGEITSDEIMNLANDRGLITSHTMSEDLFLDAARNSRITQAGARISASKPGQIAGGVSQWTDHYGKIAFLIQGLKQASQGYGKYGKMSRSQAIDALIRDTKRSHPDAGMLTPTESKYRFLIPFYTWFAKTLPFALESAARNPGRIAMFPKASYNLAVAMGVNPDSLINPFPTDQMFPTFLTEGFWGPQFVGPDGEYINVNPGIQHFDLFREIGVDPVRGIAGMTSPIIRAPLELLSGGSWQSGARINDTSDYIDQQLPIVNYIANLTGISPSGSLPSLLSGQGLDPQLQVARGNKGDFDTMLTFANWFMGMNAQNWSRPNFVNYAEIEKRDRAAEGR